MADTSKADKDGIQAMDGVAQVVESGGMFQVVIGLHVKEVFEEVEKLLPSQEEASAPAGEGSMERRRKKSFCWYKKVIASHGEDLK